LIKAGCGYCPRKIHISVNFVIYSANSGHKCTVTAVGFILPLVGLCHSSVCFIQLHSLEKVIIDSQMLSLYLIDNAFLVM